MPIKSTLCFTLADLAKAAEKFKRWGKWGENDEFGSMNFITSQMIIDAAKLVRKGKVISLSLNFDQNGPQPKNAFGGRFNPLHNMLATGVDALCGRQGNLFHYADDMISMPLQCGTQWDSLAHIFYEGKMWNGYSANLVDSKGAEKNSIDKMKDKMTGRGVLLDIARNFNLEFLEPGMAITSSDLEATAKNQSVKIHEGDILIIRTGHMEKYLKEKQWGNYCGGEAPGLGFDTLEWIYDHKIAAVCTDTSAAEVVPNQMEGIKHPWHWIAIPIMGLSVGEIFYLKDLAFDCLEDKVYEFLFTAAPLPISKAVGAPINPLAIK